MPWALKGLTQAERQQDIGTVTANLVRHAKRLGVPLAVENLDLATKKLSMRAGAVTRPYNGMLGSLPSAQFAALAQRACEREHLKLYLVNPSYSSVGGFTKYGRANRMNADTSAALWLGRQALYGDVWKTDGVQYFVKKNDERLVFSHLRATPMQRMTALSAVQWKDVARGLGVNRKLWGVKFHQWFLRQVETASRAQAPPESARAGDG